MTDAIRFDRTKLVLHAICAAVLVLSCLYVIGGDGAGHGRGVRGFMTGPFARAFILPVMTIGGLVYGIRMLLLLASPRNAIEFVEDGMRVTTAFGFKLIKWRDYRSASIQRIWVGWFMTMDQLIIKRNWKWAVRVPLGLLAVKRDRQHLLIELIELMQTRAFAMGQEMSPQFSKRFDEEARPAPAPPPTVVRPVAPAAQPVRESGFDPDAALANYLAKKRAGLLEAPGPSRGFGRKGL